MANDSYLSFDGDNNRMKYNILQSAKDNVILTIKGVECNGICIAILCHGRYTTESIDVKYGVQGSLHCITIRIIW